MKMQRHLTVATPATFMLIIARQVGVKALGGQYVRPNPSEQGTLEGAEWYAERLLFQLRALRR